MLHSLNHAFSEVLSFFLTPYFLVLYSNPTQQQLATEELGISKDAYQILKYHGSYMQSNREIKGTEKDFQFMLRLKQPAGELPPDLYRPSSATFCSG